MQAGETDDPVREIFHSLHALELRHVGHAIGVPRVGARLHFDDSARGQQAVLPCLEAPLPGFEALLASFEARLLHVPKMVPEACGHESDQQ
jgi:hypothetical protein